MRNPYMKFQKPSMGSLKVNLYTNKHDYGTDDTQADKPKAICTTNFFEAGGIKTWQK